PPPLTLFPYTALFRSVALTPAEEAFKREAAEQHQAQVAWCDYLQELYKRAANGTTTWPRYAQCTEVTTLAAPKMLKQTADCSLRSEEHTSELQSRENL